MKATIDLPATLCPVCGEEMFVLKGIILEHGDVNGPCAGGGQPCAS